MKPHHDQGRLHVPFAIKVIADPEPLDRLLDLDLGSRHITPKGRTEPPFQGENLVSVFIMFEGIRKKMICIPCFRYYQKNYSHPKCSCTLRKRFLERWLCIVCFIDEQVANAELSQQDITEEDGDVIERLCGCGTPITLEAGYMEICNWCRGHVQYEEDESDDDASANGADTSSTMDEDDDNFPPGHTNPEPDGIYYCHNKDGTLSVFYQGQRISGEPLGHSILAAQAIRDGKDMPCTCCACPHLPEREHEHHEGRGDQGRDEDEDDGEEGQDELQDNDNDR
ncbi:hypothetical protein EK21DRAFT_112726 [Setomelanomma holmii]|uniref:Uncharacterized protein n=1 Tax=Setomelanomma holmii TaxID=210430 RepID=A0A9P4H7R2_9PLEO|nr:hypothetical protein EK21DRAFT_112726 [Setomelanomma holmii]